MVSISSFAPVAQPPVAYAQVGQIPVGQESAQQRLQRIRPVEQAPSAASAADNKRTTQAKSDSADTVENVSDQDKRKQAREAVNEKAAKAEHEQLKQLAARDREVRAHEQAHKAVAGSYGGAIHFEYERGPDGNRYAVGGEVSIDTSPESSPEATLAKARTIQRAANAPAEPSDQDRAVAAQAVQMEQVALQQIAQSQQDGTRTSSENKQVEAASAAQPASEKPTSVQVSGAEVESARSPTGLSEGDSNARAQSQPEAYFGSNEHADKLRGMYRSGNSESLNFHAQA